MVEILFNLSRELLTRLILECDDEENRRLLARGLRALQNNSDVLHVIHENELKKKDKV